MPPKPETLLDLLKAVEEAAQSGELSADAARNLSRWLKEPQYAKYHDDLAALVAARNFKKLEDLFWQEIPFGTGGRRGPMANFGSATINDRTIAESAHGLAVYLKQALGRAGGTAVVACDTRHRSQEFAELVATTLAAHGLKVYLFESFRSTPALSFAVRHLNCDIGAMISASHNPPADNGIKAYWSSGGQVLAPHDAGIIRCVADAGEIPQIDLRQAVHINRIEIVGSEVDEAYWNAVLAMSLSDARDLPALYSPLHGVGETSCWQILTRAGFKGAQIFGPQRTPDGSFPNVPQHMPNPERVQVFEPMLPHARQMDAAVLIASDPDADRMAVCVRNPAGEYVHLSGNQIGALLADYILRKRGARGDLKESHYVVETLVTTRLIGAIARQHGVRVIDDLLVGFKYIAETMDAEGPDQFVFGAEESLGYLAGTYARDKDAGIATLYLAECAAELRRDGRTLLDRLDELYAEHGYYAESQVSQTCEGSEGSRQIARLMSAFRDAPPAELGDIPFALVHDYARHETRTVPGNEKIAELFKPSGDLLVFESMPGNSQVRVAVRPSGTEPKIKFYLFVRTECRDSDSLSEAKASATGILDRVGKSLKAWMAGVLG
ncbi:MAG: phospho-sugar mutase [Planctomycetaceae bacterium]|nr:phospho-sugar mutase [Planctomycetaceae bacterium]